MPPDGPPPPACPRCGYDQSGTVATWAESCPLNGMCPECGYEFAWHAVFNADEKRLPRFVEHCPRRAAPVSALRTLLWALIPGRFWSRVKLHHEVRKRRWVLWIMLVLVGWHGVNVSIHAGAMWSFDLAYYRELVARRARLMAQPALDGLPQASAPLPAAPWPSWKHLRGPLLWPFDRTGSGLMASSGTGLGSLNWAAMLDRDSSVLLLGLGASMSMPLVMLVIPATRRTYKVRWAHAGRATVFGLSWLAVPLAIRTWNGLHRLLAAQELRGGWAGHLPGMIEMQEASTLSFVAIVVFLAWWWWRALGRGWGLPRSFAHAMALVSIAVLAWLVVLAAFDSLLATRIIALQPNFRGGYLPRVHNPWRR